MTRKPTWKPRPEAETDAPTPPLTIDQVRVLAMTYLVWRVGHGAVTAMFADGPLSPTLAWDAQFYLSISHGGYQLTDPTFESF